MERNLSQTSTHQIITNAYSTVSTQELGDNNKKHEFTKSELKEKTVVLKKKMTLKGVFLHVLTIQDLFGESFVKFPANRGSDGNKKK